MLDRLRSQKAASRRAALIAPVVFAALFALVLTGCGPRLVPFTHELRVQNNLTDHDLENLQFYVSHRVTLRREIESGGSQITSSHKLLLISGKSIEEVIIEERTPGVAIAVDRRSMAVSFEPGASMLFSASGEPVVPEPALAPAVFATPPDPFPGNGESGEARGANDGPSAGPLAVRADETASGSYWLSAGSGAQIRYQGKLFSAIDESLKAHLMIDADSLEEVVESRKVLPGVRLPTR